MHVENFNWRRSSRSTSSGGNCIELARLSWYRSTHSGPNGGECVELADVAGAAGASVVAVRDSKDPDGPVLLLTRAALRTAIQTATDVP